MLGLLRLPARSSWRSIARYSAEQLIDGTIAPDVARRLLDADRTVEAFDIITRARAVEEGKRFRVFTFELDEVYEDCLAKLGRTDDLKAHLWETFTLTLSDVSLRKYLKLLPDFDDIEAEEKALDLAETHPDLDAVIHLLIGWPSHDRAARVVLARANELNGDSYHVLTTAADALEVRHPLAATLMRRAIVQDTLDGAKSKRYGHAARHLAECQSSEPAIADHAGFPTHEQFVAAIKQAHGRKYGFWQLVAG